MPAPVLHTAHVCPHLGLTTIPHGHPASKQVLRPVVWTLNPGRLAPLAPTPWKQHRSDKAGAGGHNPGILSSRSMYTTNLLKAALTVQVMKGEPSVPSVPKALPLFLSSGN